LCIILLHPTQDMNCPIVQPVHTVQYQPIYD
jgi:hypothetical protein